MYNFPRARTHTTLTHLLSPHCLKHQLFYPCAGVGEEDKKSRVMEITSKLTPEEVVAKVMMAARDPDLDTAAAAVATNNTAELRLA